METDSTTDGRIDLPTDFAEHLAAVSDLETPPATLAEYWSAFADRLEASDETVEAEDLYAEDSTRHEVHVNDRVRYSPCVLDALGVAVMEAEDPVMVRSIDPVTGTAVTFVVQDGSVEITPEDAVISFGVASAIPDLESNDDSVFDWTLQADQGRVSAAFCQFINAFESSDTYEQWADDTDGVTIPVAPKRAMALIRQFDGDRN